MAPEPRPKSPTPVGATPSGAKKKGGRGRLVGLILAAVLILALLAVLLSRCGAASDSHSADDTNSAASSTADGSATSAGPSATEGTGSTSAPAATPAAPAAGTPGAVTSADGQSLLDLAGSPDPATALATVSGQTVTGTAVAVLSVPADEGFWVGTSDTARIWVQLTGGGESAYQVTAGDLVDFTGTLVAHDGTFAGAVGLADADGATQLTTQARHVEVAKGAVTLSPS